eukprot:gene19836-20327_t
MSTIVLSAAVRQNLISLQDTAASLATTQNRLSTGKKVNSALDNPTNFFTAAGLDNRASDISNLLDGISNGVQVLQAANTGITSIQKLIDSAKSIANQALQTQIGYSTKANVVSAAITSGGSAVTSSDLRGLGTTVSNSLTGTAVHDNTSSSPPAITGSTLLAGSASSGILSSAITTSDTLTVNGKNITFTNSGAGNTISSTGATIDLTTATVQNVLDAIDTITGTVGGSDAASISSGQIKLNTGTSADLSLTGSVLPKLGLSATTGNAATAS